jgi:DNA-binding NarL/FixJ family response regulator
MQLLLEHESIYRKEVTEAASMIIKVVIAGQTPLDCQLLFCAINRYGRHITVRGCAHTLKEFFKNVAEHHPDVAVISAGLEGDSKGGFKVLRELRAAGSTTRPILLLDSHEPEQVIEAFSAGAKGVVCKTDPLQVLCKCIQCVCARQVWANSQELEWILEALTKREPVHVVNAIGASLLTPRQEQIVCMVAEGLPNREIALELQVSTHTVKNHLFRIYEKLGVSNRVEVVLYAMSRRENSPPSSLGTSTALQQSRLNSLTAASFPR